MLSPLATALLALLVYAASATPLIHDHNDQPARRGLPGSWYHQSVTPVHSLFRRDPTNDGASYPAVGSPTWLAAYPQGSPTSVPQAWTNALNAAVAAGKIPNIPTSHLVPNASPAYPPGVAVDTPAICAATDRVCRDPDDLWDAPANTIGIGFDDGPLPPSDALYDFLAANNQRATHFFIGINIWYYPQQFLRAFDELGDDIAVHTWTHPYMTTQTNEQVLAQLGWSMQIIHDSTGGRLPRFWRPPYGDVDERVRAIAKEVFGLRTIIWNQDTGDWSLTTNGTTLPKIAASFNGWLNGPKSPGLIILEHELSDQSVQAFKAAYPQMKSLGWETISVAELVSGVNVYQNSDNGNQSPVTSEGVLFGGEFASATAPPSTSITSTETVTATASTSPLGQNVSASTTTLNGAKATTAGSKTNGAQTIRTWWRDEWAWAILGVAVLLR